MSIEVVISGGQAGADQAAWRAAKRFGIKTTGWMPRHFLTEDGPRPEFAELYGAQEHPRDDYPSRTASNIGLADYALLFGNPETPGSRLLRRLAREVMLPVLIVGSPAYRPENVLRALRRYGGVKSLLIAGNRESFAPGIGAWVELYLDELFRQMKETDRVG